MAAHHHGPARGGVQSDADVAEIRARHRAQIGGVAGIVEADKRLVGVAFLVDGQQLLDAGQPDGAEIDGLQDAAVER